MPFKKILVLTLFLSTVITLRGNSQSENGDLLNVISKLNNPKDSVVTDSKFASDSVKLAKNDSELSIQNFDSLFVKTDSIKKTARVQLGGILSRLVNNSKNYSIELGKLRLILSDIPDTTLLNARIPELKQELNQLEDFTAKWEGDANLRYLKGVENFLKYIEVEKANYDKIINNRLEDLLEVGKKIDEIRSDSLLNLTLRDSTSLPEIRKELVRLKTTIREIDSTLVTQELELTKIQANISDLTIKILGLHQFFKTSEIKVKQDYWKKETNYLWESSEEGDKPSVLSVVLNSERINTFVLKKYLNTHYFFFVSFSLFMVLLYFTSKSLIQRIKKKKEFAELILERAQLLEKNLLASFFVMGIPVYFLLSKNPPMAFISILSTGLAFFASWLVRSHFGNKLFYKWILFFPILVFSSILALNWRITYAEKPLIYIMALVTIFFSWSILKDIRDKKFNGSSVLRFLIFFSIGFSVFSLGLNILGRFSLSKVFAITGVTSFYRGVSLYLFVQIVLKTVYLWMESSKKNSDNLTSFFDFQEIQKRLQGILNLLAFFLWFYAVVYHLGLFTPIYESIVGFISEERTLGNATFTFGTILLFFLILVISQFLANNIAYFATIKDQQHADSRKKRLGSSILLIRLGVITIGFLIAMTAAKIPLDKITIVLGALSVGIGFGLQTLINNLVSGIILAFERPIQIGDDIKIGELSGKVKEVGVRASKILAYDGSDIVVPNGDLLSGQLINWTLSDKRRRVEIFVGVAYSSNMKLVKETIEKQLVNERILKIPEPKVFMENFGDNSVDFRILFWVGSMDYWLETKAEVMTGIFDAFVENGIEIPFPQRDLYIKSMPNLKEEKGTKPNQQLPPNDEENT
jgi:small-conductance mechanosensitive channel